MGSTQAAGYAEAVEEGIASLDMALTAHLGSNHYPPVHPVFVPVAKEAIELANDGNWAAELTLPNGITKSVSEIIDELHLDAFLTPEED